MEKKDDQESIANFLYEIGTMRKLARIHRQVLLTDDLSDNIASHSYRVTMICWFLAKEENANPYKTVMMGLLHDTAETRSNDHNWVHKRYITIDEGEINKDQLGTLPHPELKEIIDEYETRESKEALLAKDADTLDQILLLREYEMTGNKEAEQWLYEKEREKTKVQIKKLKTQTAIKLGEALYDTNPSDWWKNLYTSENKK